MHKIRRRYELFRNSLIIETMKKIFCSLAFILFNYDAISQAGAFTNDPHISSALDMSKEQNKGILLPQVNLSNTADNAVINGASPVTGLLVYNPNSTISGAGARKAGYYYWDGRWRKILTQHDTRFWMLNGNTNTDPSIHFIGTKDVNDLAIKANNWDRIRILNDGKIGFFGPAATYVTPANALVVKPGEGSKSGLSFTNLTSSSPAAPNAAPLGIDAAGKVVITASNNKKSYFYATIASLPTTSEGFFVTGMTVDTDPSGLYNPSTGEFTALEDGGYIIKYGADFPANGAGGVIVMSLHHSTDGLVASNRTNYQPSITYATVCSFTKYLKLKKNERVRIFIATDKRLTASQLFYSVEEF